MMNKTIISPSSVAVITTAKNRHHHQKQGRRRRKVGWSKTSFFFLLLCLLQCIAANNIYEEDDKSRSVQNYENGTDNRCHESVSTSAVQATISSRGIVFAIRSNVMNTVGLMVSGNLCLQSYLFFIIIMIFLLTWFPTLYFYSLASFLDHFVWYTC